MEGRGCRGDRRLRRGKKIQSFSMAAAGYLILVAVPALQKYQTHIFLSGFQWYGCWTKKRQLKNNHQNQTHVSRTEANKNKPDMHTKPCIIQSPFHSRGWGVGKFQQEEDCKTSDWSPCCKWCIWCGQWTSRSGKLDVAGSFVGLHGYHNYDGNNSQENKNTNQDHDLFLKQTRNKRKETQHQT